MWDMASRNTIPLKSRTWIGAKILKGRRGGLIKWCFGGGILPVLKRLQEDPASHDIVRIEYRKVSEYHANYAAGVSHKHRPSNACLLYL